MRDKRISERLLGSPNEVPEVPDTFNVWFHKNLINSSFVSDHETWSIEAQIEGAIRPHRQEKVYFAQVRHHQDFTDFALIRDYNEWKWQDSVDAKHCCLFKASIDLHKWMYTWWDDRWAVKNVLVKFDKQDHTAIIIREESR